MPGARRAPLHAALFSIGLLWGELASSAPFGMPAAFPPAAPREFYIFSAMRWSMLGRWRRVPPGFEYSSLTLRAIRLRLTCCALYHQPVGAHIDGRFCSPRAGRRCAVRARLTLSRLIARDFCMASYVYHHRQFTGRSAAHFASRLKNAMAID